MCLCLLHRELPNPKLELYDLDDAFSSEKARLAQVTNKCTDDDLVLFSMVKFGGLFTNYFIWEIPGVLHQRVC